MTKTPAFDSPMRRPAEADEIDRIATEDIDRIRRDGMTKADKRSKPPVTDRTGFENVPDNVPRPTEAVTLPPQDTLLKAGQALLGDIVRVLVGGHMQTVILTDYDQSSNTYDGLAIRCKTGEGSDHPPIFTAVHGLRPYEQGSRKQFMWVLPGLDESPLINLAQRDAVRNPDESAKE